MTNPSVSVVIPVYNAENYLKETIESVLNQTYQDFELLLIDHNSSDKSSLIIEQYVRLDKRVKSIHLGINKGGPAYPRNEGMKMANGKYIAFLDADDMWLPQKLEKQINVISEGGYDIVHTLADIIDAKSQKTGKSNNQKIYKILKYFLSDIIILYFTNYININTVLMRKELDIQFREDKYLIALEDMFFWIENLFYDKKVYCLEETLIYYRVLNYSASNRTSDTSFRKLFYLYAVLLNENKLSLKVFSVVCAVNMLKIGMRNIKNTFFRIFYKGRA